MCLAPPPIHSKELLPGKQGQMSGGPSPTSVLFLHDLHWTTIYGKPGSKPDFIRLFKKSLLIFLPHITWQLDDRICLYIKGNSVNSYNIELSGKLWPRYFTHWTFCCPLLRSVIWVSSNYYKDLISEWKSSLDFFFLPLSCFAYLSRNWYGCSTCKSNFMVCSKILSRTITSS